MEAAKKIFFAAKEPFCLLRVSDSELCLLGAHYLPEEVPQPISWYIGRGDLQNFTPAIRRTFIDSLQKVEMVGLQQNWKPITEASAILLKMVEIPLPMPNSVDVHLPYQLLADGSLFRWLEGKRVLLIGYLGPKLAEAWKTKEFQDAYRSWGPVDKATIVGSIRMGSKAEGGAFKDYETAIRELDKYRYDVALLSCGITAKPLAWEIRQRNITAVDVGFVFNALLGGGERTQRPILRDVKWPTVKWSTA